VKINKVCLLLTIGTCSGLLTGSLPVDIRSTGLMTREPEDEVDGEARLGMELICSDEQLVEDDLKF